LVGGAVRGAWFGRVWRAAPGGRCLGWAGCWADLAAADFPVAWATVSWALEGFTAEFGKGSGGSPSAKATRSAEHSPGGDMAGRGIGGGVRARLGAGGACIGSMRGLLPFGGKRG